MRARQIGLTIASLGAMSASGAVQKLWELRGANMQSTSDQAFTKVFTGTAWAIATIETKLGSGTITTLTAGGIYTGANKTGTAVVSAIQLWTSIPLIPTLAVQTVLTAAALNLSLTVGSLSASTADFFIFGYLLD